VCESDVMSPPFFLFALHVWLGGAARPSPEEGARGACFFVQTATAQAGNGREMVPAVVDTWVADAPDQSRVFYMVDEPAPPYHLPASVKEAQLIKVVHEDYAMLPERTRVAMVALNTRSLKQRCDWFVVVDDDTYVNAANVAAKVSQYDASKPHYMGAIYGVSDGKTEGGMKFVHGDFRIFSAAAMPMIAGAVARCDEFAEPGMEDVRLAQCFESEGLTDTLQAEAFGDWVHDNDREHHTTLEKAKKDTRPTGCLDFVHKLSAPEMHEFHAMVKARPSCKEASSSLLFLEASSSLLFLTG